MKELKLINKILRTFKRKEKSNIIEKVLKELIDDLEGRTYLEKG